MIGTICLCLASSWINFILLMIRTNLCRYYGYRNMQKSCDPRVEALASRKELFENRIVLDIGCNIGHVTYLIARDFSPKSIHGIDLDNHLIQIARKNLRFSCNSNSPGVDNMLKGIDLSSVSSQPIRETSNSSSFPYNVSFMHVGITPQVDSLKLAMKKLSCN